MEEYIPKINKFINSNGFNDNIIITNKTDLNIKQLNILLSKNHKNSVIYYSNDNIFDLDKSKEKRPEPIFKFDNEKNIGYIKFFHFIWSNDIFTKRTLLNFKNLIENKLKIWEQKNYNKLIIDLTEQTGDSYINIIESLSYLLGDITLFSFINKNYKQSRNNITEPIWINLKDDKINDYPQVFKSSKFKFNGKIAVLISNKTSDSGEFMTVLFKNRDNVLIIGSNTNGNLVKNNIFLLDNIDNKNLYLSLTTKIIMDFKSNIYNTKFIQPDIKTNSFKDSMKKAYTYLLSI